MLKRVFHWRFSGVLIPFFVGIAGLLISAGLSLDEFDLAFYLADFFLVCGAIWTAGYWLTSEFLAERRARPTRRNRHPNQTRFRVWKYGTLASIAAAFTLSVAFVNEIHQRKMLSAFSGDLIAGNDPMPSNPCREPIIPTPSAVVVFYGKSAAWADRFPFAAIKIHGETILAFHKRDDGVAIDAIVKGSDGRLIAKISKNAYVVNRNNTLRMIRPDRSTLIVEDERGRQALNVRHLNRRAVKITGLLYYGPGLAITITDELMIFPVGPLSFDGGCFAGGIDVK